MRIEPLRPEHAAALAARAPGARLDDLAHVGELIAAGPAFAAIDGDGRPFAVLGVADHGGGRGFAWCALARDARPEALAVSLTRAVRRWLAQAPFRRIEMVTVVGHDAAERWAIRLGFLFESVSVAWTDSGADVLRWSLVRRAA